jgi:fido (protein-threonine AMPylation protein)
MSMLNEGFYRFQARLFPMLSRYYIYSPSQMPLSDAFQSVGRAFWLKQFVLVGNGNCGCKLTEPRILDDCKIHCDEVQRVISKNKKLEDEFYTEQAFRGTGHSVENGVDGVVVNVGINPKRTINYRNMLERLTKEMVQQACFFDKSSDDIICFIQELHRLLFEGLPAEHADLDNHLRPGQFRKKHVMVAYVDVDILSHNALHQELRRLGATQEELAAFTRSYDLLFSDEEAAISIDILTAQQKKLWEKLGHLAPGPKQVLEEMRSFVETLKQCAKQDVHPVALAAWAHAQLVRIHPFSDGNGKVARAWKDALLLRGGFFPTAIVSDEKYSEAVREDAKTPGRFAAYLAKTIRVSRFTAS